MHYKDLLMVLAIVFVIIAAGTVVFAQSDSIKTHEYNFSNKAFFNISDDLTNETEFELSQFDSLGGGVYYEYPDEKGFCSLWFVGDDGLTEFEGYQEDESYKEIESNTTTCEGYKTYIFNDSDEYVVFVDLNNLSVVYDDGFDEHYYYFRGSFETLDEVQIFTDTFRINETTTISAK